MIHTVKRLSILILFLVLTGLMSNSVQAQYFGQNKVRYKNLKFNVYQTPHFEFYHYLKNESLVKRFAKETETWYKLHQQVFRDTFLRKNPFILYNNAPDFQQTTAIQGEIGVGTGGVTEGLKNRVVMPITQLNHQTRHVLGHELVHAFQYHSLIEGDSTTLENIGNLPLWMVEGMAEYLSIGKVDAFTSMWMRDAYLNKDIPSLKDLTTSGKYFPYRYGQAFWSYIGSTYGDTVIVPLFKETARFGYERAILKTFGFTERTLSSLWKTSIENAYQPFLKDTTQTPIGKRILDDKNAGEMNVAPSVSPDGKYVAFLSEKELFSIDLFLADAQTGKIIRKLTSKTRNSHIDEFNFIESAGAWSPDSKRFAFSAFAEGRNKLFVIDTQTGRTLATESMGEVEEFSNITWSPDGRSVAFSGLKEGQSDLYLFDLQTKKLEQLTNDPYSDYHPSFANNGQQIVFSSDRTTLEDSDKSIDITYNLATIDLVSLRIRDIPVFNGANNLNPQFSGNDEYIYFLSNRDGFRNLYRYHIDDRIVEQLTDYFTGISGITEFAPALSVSKTDQIVYTYYRAQKYQIYSAQASDFTPLKVDPQALNFDAATLPPPRQAGVDVINANLKNFERFEQISDYQIEPVPFRSKFKLDYLSGNGIGASVGRFGTGLASGIQGIFSDILGRDQIYTAAAVNGEIYDFGAQIAYVNQQGRVNWGAGVSHIPYITAYLSQDLINNGQVFRDSYDIIRTFEDKLQLFGSYPFSKINRFEMGASAATYYYRIDRFSQYYEMENGIPAYFVGADREKVSLQEANNFYNQAYGVNFQNFNIYGFDAAFVGDNSNFGLVAPLEGYRYRIGLNKMFGDFDLTVATVDLRKYVRLNKITLAGRILNSMSFGNDNNQFFAQQFVGNPIFIRGYEYNSFYREGDISSAPGDFSIEQLVGSKMAIANFEVRLPFTGPKKLSAVESKLLFSDLNAFFDIGLAYNSASEVRFAQKPQQIGMVGNNPVYSRVPAMSAGLSLRVNVFGYFVLEPYYAIPFQRKNISGGVFGMTFAPGW
jgi:Tol biopolymer transport system component